MTIIRRLLGIVALAAAAVFAWAYYERYWRWRDCFNELGRCWDSTSEQVYVEQAGIVWGGGVVLFLGLAVILLWPRRRGSPRQR